MKVDPCRQSGNGPQTGWTYQNISGVDVEVNSQKTEYLQIMHPTCYLWFPKVILHLSLSLYGSLLLVVFGPIAVTYLILPMYMCMQMV